MCNEWLAKPSTIGFQLYQLSAVIRRVCDEDVKAVKSQSTQEAYDDVTLIILHL